MSIKAADKNKPRSIMETVNKIAFIIILLYIGTVSFCALAAGKWNLFASFLLDCLAMAATVILCINIHELGHYAFGKLCGYKLLSYSIGCFAWINENGHLKPAIRKNKGAAGLCSMQPPEEILPDYKYCLYYAGGITFNLLTALIVAVPYAYIPSASAVWNRIILEFIIISLLFGLLNFIPFVSGNNPSDGKLLRSLLLKKPFAEKLKGINTISAQLSSGCRPKELNILCQPDTEKPGAFDMMLLLCQYFKSLDNRNRQGILKFANLLENNLMAFSRHSLPTVYYELCFVGCITNDTARAKHYYEKAGRTLTDNNSVTAMRIKAYYEYYVNKNSRAALNCCENALSVADKFPVKGQRIMETELVERLKIYLTKIN